MNKSTLVAAIMSVALAAATLPGNAAAMTLSAPRMIAAADSGLLQSAAIVCGAFGCGPIWPGPRRQRWGWGAWQYAYRPACPIGYSYACRRGPLGYGQCACWPYRAW